METIKVPSVVVENCSFYLGACFERRNYVLFKARVGVFYQI